VHQLGLRTVAIAVLGLAAACGGDDGAEPSVTSASTTTTASDAATSPTTADGGSSTSAPVADQIALRGDGLGVVDLGVHPDDAIAAVSAALGDPTVDTGWSSSSGTYGTCPGEQIRGVEWGGLVLIFTNGDTEQGSGEHLFAWRITAAPPALSTAAGFGLGATSADAEQLYPGQVEAVPPEEPFPGFLRIDADGGTITAYLDGDVVTNLEAGSPCGE